MPLKVRVPIGSYPPSRPYSSPMYYRRRPNEPYHANGVALASKAKPTSVAGTKLRLMLVDSAAGGPVLSVRDAESGGEFLVYCPARSGFTIWFAALSTRNGSTGDVIVGLAAPASISMGNVELFSFHRDPDAAGFALTLMGPRYTMQYPDATEHFVSISGKGHLQTTTEDGDVVVADLMLAQGWREKPCCEGELPELSLDGMPCCLDCHLVATNANAAPGREEATAQTQETSYSRFMATASSSDFACHYGVPPPNVEYSEAGVTLAQRTALALAALCELHHCGMYASPMLASALYHATDATTDAWLPNRPVLLGPNLRATFYGDVGTRIVLHVWWRGRREQGRSVSFGDVPIQRIVLSALPQDDEQPQFVVHHGLRPPPFASLSVFTPQTIGMRALRYHAAFK